MNKKISQFLTKDWIAVVLVVVFFIGIFFRTYNLEDWLFFQADQSRDFNMISRAIEEGPGSLPLLGPKAGGTYLRLGPIFYYFQYISALIFGIGSPVNLAFPDLLFGILTLPLLFLFLKEFFSKKWALLLTSGYTFSFFAIQYSRFAWNPNSAPFFNLLFFYGIFQFFKSESGRKKTVWAIIIGVSYAIASQLHFVCFLGLPLALLAVILIRRFFFKNKNVRYLKYFGIVVFIFILFYIPVILSDLQTDWNNSLNFLSSFEKKSSDSSLLNLLKKDAIIFSKYFLTISFGIVAAPDYLIFLAGFLIILAIGTGLFLIKKEIDPNRKFFILLSLIWFFAYFLPYIPIATKLQPRHFLPILPVPFVFIGLIASSLRFINLKHKFLISGTLLLLPVIANAYYTNVWFSEIKDSQLKISNPRKSNILKSVEGETWWHLEKVSEFMHQNCTKDKLFIIPPKQSYRSLFDYSMEYVKEARDFSIKWSSFPYNEDTCYYVIFFTKNDLSDRFGKYVSILKQERFGDVSIISFDVNKDMLKEGEEIRNLFRKKKLKDEEIIREIKVIGTKLELEDPNTEEEEAEEDIEEIKEDQKEAEEENNAWFNIENAGREPRVFWRDLFN